MLEHTTYLQQAFELAPQGADESDSAFRHRIAGELRDMSKVIEAHEAQQNARWDDEATGGDVLAGVMGALAQAAQGVDFHVHGEQQVGCDLVAGLYVKHKKPDPSPDSMLLMLDLLGGRR
jgi:hypothetical protein